VHAWQLCHIMGRDGMTGRMMASEVVAVLAAIGGTEADLDKVVAMEHIYQLNNPQEGLNDGRKH